MKHPGGRPRMFKTPEEMEKVLLEYIAKCDEKEKIPCIAGAAESIGMDRHTFYNYSNKDEFFHTIKRFRELIANRIESACINGEGSTAGTIFVMKNYGYTDRQDHNHKIEGSLNKIVQNTFFEDGDETKLN
jgi:hypothetical protein